jgi:hypothetical protein
MRDEKLTALLPLPMWFPTATVTFRRFGHRAQRSVASTHEAEDRSLALRTATERFGPEVDLVAVVVEPADRMPEFRQFHSVESVRRASQEIGHLSFRKAGRRSTMAL